LSLVKYIFGHVIVTQESPIE